MASVTIELLQFEMRKIPPVCICCGAKATQMQPYTYRKSSILVGILLGPLVRFLLSQVIRVKLPLCAEHTYRLKYPNFVALGLVLTMFVAAAFIFVYSLFPDMGSGREASLLFGLVLFLTLPVWTIAYIVVLQKTPRATDIQGESVKFDGVAPAFAASIRNGGGALGWLTGQSTGAPQTGYHASSAAPGYGKKKQPTLDFQKIAMIGAGGVVACLVLWMVVGFGLQMMSRRPRHSGWAQNLPPGPPPHWAKEMGHNFPNNAPRPAVTPSNPGSTTGAPAFTAQEKQASEDAFERHLQRLKTHFAAFAKGADKTIVLRVSNCDISQMLELAQTLESAKSMKSLHHGPPIDDKRTFIATVTDIDAFANEITVAKKKVDRQKGEIHLDLK